MLTVHNLMTAFHQDLVLPALQCLPWCLPAAARLYCTVYLVGSAEAVFSKFSKLLENGLKRCVLLSYTHILGFSLGGQL